MSKDLTTGNRESLTAKHGASSSVVDRVFQKMHVMFGSAWLDRWKGAPMDAVKADWDAALTGFDVATIRLAFDELQRSGVEFPPSQPAFIAMCRKHVRRGASRLLLAAPFEPAPEGAIDHLHEVIRCATPPSKRADPNHILGNVEPESRVRSPSEAAQLEKRRRAQLVWLEEQARKK